MHIHFFFKNLLKSYARQRIVFIMLWASFVHYLRNGIFYNYSFRRDYSLSFLIHFANREYQSPRILPAVPLLLYVVKSST